MLGLGFGSLIGGYFADRGKNLIRIYVLVEISLGLFGVLSLPLLRSLGELTAGSSVWISMLSMSLFLAIPTSLMGMTLPLVIKIFNHCDRNFLRSVSSLYCINTLGAAFGCLLATFVIISHWGIDTTIYVGASIDLLLAFVIASVASIQGEQSFSLESTPIMDDPPASADLGRDSTESSALSDQKNSTALFSLVFLSGFLAIAYEIAWFRFLQVLVKSSPYSYSTILFVYLLGIGFGSYFCTGIAGNLSKKNRRNLFFLFQAFVGMYALLSIAVYYILTRDSDFRLLTVSSFSFYTAWPSTQWYAPSPYFVIAALFIWPILFMFLPTLAMGATFPLMSSLSFNDGNDEGKSVGFTYFFTTLGNVTGGIVTGFVLLSSLGSEITFLLLGVLGTAMILLVSNDYLSRSKKVFVLALALLAVVLFPKQGELYSLVNRCLIPPGEHASWHGHLQEGVDGVIYTMTNGSVFQHYINGFSHGRRPDIKYYVETIEAIAYAKQKENVLIIGFGTGTILEIVQLLSEVKKITVIEICPSSIANLKKFPLFQKMLADGRVNLVIDDGRRYLLSHKEKYDLVLMDPLRSTEAYSNNIYSKQFFECLKQHLSDAGIVLLWLDEFKILPHTVTSVFPFVRQYDFFCLASNNEMNEIAGAKDNVMNCFDKNLQKEIIKHSANFVADQEKMKDSLQKYPINQDWRPYCEYWIR